jgi:hypothetical protein
MSPYPCPFPQAAGACAGEGSAKVDVGVVCRVVAASFAFYGQPNMHKVRRLFATPCSPPSVSHDFVTRVSCFPHRQ